MAEQRKQANESIADETLKIAERWQGDIANETLKMVGQRRQTREKHREREPSQMITNSGELPTPLLSYRRRAGLCGNSQTLLSFIIN